VEQVMAIAQLKLKFLRIRVASVPPVSQSRESSEGLSFPIRNPTAGSREPNAGALSLPSRHDRTGRCLSVGVVAVVHLLLLWLLLTNGMVRPTETAARNLQAFIVNSPRSESSPPPELAKPFQDFVPAPDIQIELPPAPTAVAEIDRAAMSQLLPPRPDPSHPNPAPVLPQSLQGHAGAAEIVLRILVLPDGSIGEAQIAKSSGQPQLDVFAAQFAQANWRFAPAMIGGRPLQDWTTVLMRITAS
jgi:TonB family protein